MGNLVRAAGEANTPESPTQFAASGPSGFDIFIPDRGYETTPGIAQALAAVRSEAPLVFISGRAGTGKSRLIGYLRKIPGGESTVVVAPTGVAAMELDAMTIHTAFRLSQGVLDTEGLASCPISPIFRSATRLVIDEISMVRADVLDGIDARLRSARGDDRPFGGLQVIMVGDFLQLPPVVRDDDEEILWRLGYDTPFAFSARALRGMTLRVAHLCKVWRQKDPEMIDVLSDIRENRHLEEALDWLNTKCAGPHRPGVNPMILTATRAAADYHNRAGILRMSDAARGVAAKTVFRADKTDVFENAATPLPAPDDLILIPGMRVMSVRNDPAGRYVNGSLGTVLSCHPCGDQSHVRVLFDGFDEAVRVDRASWTKTRQVWCTERQAIVREAAGRYTQIPLVHGYAITIHKAQGLSLDDVRVDLGNGAFAPGQLYVAISRARTAEGLSLTRPARLSDIHVDEQLLGFLSATKAQRSQEMDSGW